MAGTSPAMTVGKETCHGESKTQGEGKQGKSEKAQDEDGRQIRKIRETRASRIVIARPQAATVHRQSSSR
jgi:hypothetical protein